ncbi:glucose-6-phosphate isomerase [Ottowia sp.]|uniref:glucose-6-phosphate isomerase n=1 Tax=Ottowia sp. TaxID=1898956 RepID=UPI002CB77CFA|nr:glucose-6-phosphate isomerase [Ottowia sp.]HRN74958.1 glucose-6-phosphate isomerase [Ottowia sp.]HRQ01831.1 glucose-6-phosphate isomerase [Ottowia sp.]
MDWRDRPRCDEVPAWRALAQHFQQRFSGTEAFDLRRAFNADAGRAEHFSLEAAGVYADLSKNLIDAEALTLLTGLARECGVEAHRDAMFSGAPINVSEQRAVTHVHWRMPGSAAPAADTGTDAAACLVTNAARARAEMLDFAESVRADPHISDVVNIGIGGSDLGPRLVVEALRASGHVDGPRLHFVANMDGHELAGLLPQLKPRSTLFIVASKSFGTAETVQNATSARDWFKAQGGQDIARHFVALSTNQAAAEAFGAGRCLGFDDGVGGRFSLWSSIGLSIAIAIGRAGFENLLAGAHAMDRHFADTPLERNLPVQLALLDLWYRNLHGLASRCVAPYHHGLRTLPAYLQQLEMESNGKRVDLRGRTLPFASAAVTWGQAGSNGQHAFFQQLHQGTDVVPVEFVLVRQAAHALPGHHAQLLAKALAQARALMLGQTGDVPARHFPGNRPSTILLLHDLSPHSLGTLLAMYEHRTFTLGSLWGLNSFDQWGVELGKRFAHDLIARLDHGDVAGLDASTAALITRLRQT